MRCPSCIGIAFVTLLALSGCTGTPRAVTLPPFDAAAFSGGSRGAGGFESGGAISRIRWYEDALTFERGGTRYTCTLASGVVREGDVDPSARRQQSEGSTPRRRAGRGRQRDREPSPDGVWVAECRDWNVVLEPGDAAASDARPIEVTTDGTRKRRYGKASWVYGEELAQRTAMWWSGDSKQLVFYAFDERRVPDFYLLGGLTDRRPALKHEGYPKPGEPNPRADLMVYNVETGKTRRLECHGAPEEEWYIYGVQFAADGRLLFFRTNRHQDHLELVAADVGTGHSDVLVTETQRTWQRNRPLLRFLADGRFIWETERAGVRALELRDASGARLTGLTGTDHPFVSLLDVDEETGTCFYTAYGPDHPLNVHLYRVRLDGTDRRRLTPAGRSHTIALSPDRQWFVSRAETIADMPSTRLFDADGNAVAVLAEPDESAFATLGTPRPELFSFPARDGTPLFGWIYKPRGFDPGRAYPLVIDVYGGPESKGVRNRFRATHPACRLGVAVAKIDNRGTLGRGKAFAEAIYQQLGSVDLQDQADGVRHLLATRDWLDPDRVGIYGHSYGGYMAALAILKYPDLFHVAVAGAPVTDWRNYDTIYTERYMRTPAENPEGYDAGSCLTYAANLRGHLLLMHGMQDDNVHATNTWQLVEALRKAGKHADTVLYPESAHGLARGASRVRWEYLHEHLAMPRSPDDGVEAESAVAAGVTD
ncbi:MAG: S9 family peptidase [Phycisphaerales bacterium]|nr:DPP IV N-terminal domain-containing protein [Phycisphaerae bacterium]NNF43603.1 S9 family peptidase [Phycisphaerales bacterium]NNM26086.1 S9 family peptidase [Phycisphaerales bacterium]